MAKMATMTKIAKTPLWGVLVARELDTLCLPELKLCFSISALRVAYTRRRNERREGVD